MFVVMKIQSWDNITTTHNLPFPISLDFKNEISIGYLPVYETLEDLLIEFPGKTNYVEVRPIEN